MLNHTTTNNNAPMSFSDWMKQKQACIEMALAEFLPSPQPDSSPASDLHEAMRYAALDGGKRVRPLLVFAAGELIGANEEELTRAACAVEMIHVYSLVHDDMPCMDDDALRRGRPTVHVKFNEATALLVGDALQAQAFWILAQGKNAATQQLKMLQILAHAAGSLGMCGGQALDLASVDCAISRQQLERMHQLKTGALLRASVLLGALCSPSESVQINPIEHAALERYANAIGLAFQVIDDILDATSNSATLGKTSGKDAAKSKPTYVSMLGLEASRAFAENLRIEAHQALQLFATTRPNSRSQRLFQLADFIVQRSA